MSGQDFFIINHLDCYFQDKYKVIFSSASKRQWEVDPMPLSAAREYCSLNSHGTLRTFPQCVSTFYVFLQLPVSPCFQPVQYSSFQSSFKSYLNWENLKQSVLSQNQVTETRFQVNGRHYNLRSHGVLSSPWNNVIQTPAAFAVKSD